MWELQGGGVGSWQLKLQKVALLQWDDGAWLPRHHHRQTGSPKVKTANVISKVKEPPHVNLSLNEWKCESRECSVYKILKVKCINIAFALLIIVMKSWHAFSSR